MIIRAKITNSNTKPQYLVREFPNGKEFYNALDGEEWIHHYKITKPQGIISDLKQCEEDLDLSRRLKGYAEFVDNTKIFKNEKIYGISGFGGLTTVFDIGEDRVLKISKENPFEYRKYNPKFDIPLKSDIVHYGDLYGYIQQKADTENITVNNVLKVKRKMKRAGYTSSNDFSNYRTEQVGTYNGKSYLLDSRCAITRNDRKTRFADWFKMWFDRSPLIAIRIDDIIDAPPTHIDETPKANYTKKEARKVIKDVLKSWENSYNTGEKIIFKVLKAIKII